MFIVLKENGCEDAKCVIQIQYWLWAYICLNDNNEHLGRTVESNFDVTVGKVFYLDKHFTSFELKYIHVLLFYYFNQFQISSMPIRQQKDGPICKCIREAYSGLSLKHYPQCVQNHSWKNEWFCITSMTDVYINQQLNSSCPIWII